MSVIFCESTNIHSDKFLVFDINWYGRDHFNETPCIQYVNSSYSARMPFIQTRMEVVYLIFSSPLNESGLTFLQKRIKVFDSHFTYGLPEILLLGFLTFLIRYIYIFFKCVDFCIYFNRFLKKCNEQFLIAITVPFKMIIFLYKCCFQTLKKPK